MKHNNKKNQESQVDVTFNSLTTRQKFENWELVKEKYDEKGAPGFVYIVSIDPKECQAILYRDKDGHLLAVARYYERKRKNESENFIEYNFHPDGLDDEAYDKIMKITSDFWISEEGAILLFKKINNTN